MASGSPPVAATVEALAAEIESLHYRPSELEAIARLLLRDQPVRLVAGEWWAYGPDSGTLVYPAHLLHEWSGVRAVGALCHEVAEALYAGPEAGKAIYRFATDATRYRVEHGSAVLLLNVVNDFRVNNRYLRAYPGASLFLRSLYAQGTELHPKNDVRGRRSAERPLSHHLFLDGLIARWIAGVWPDVDRSVDGRVADAVRRGWPDAAHAADADSMAECAGRLTALLPLYGQLIERSRQELAEEQRRPPPNELEPEPPPADEEPDEDWMPPAADETKDLEPPGGDQGVFFFVREDAPIGALPPEETEERAPKPPRSADEAEGREPAQPLPRPSGLDAGPRWAGGVIQRIRRFKPRGGPDYEQFDYVRKVRQLEPLIDATVHGRGGAPGLAQILTLRRFGTADPYRRPRRFRRGDTGDLDEDRPENLLIDPAVAFLKGVRQQRQDSLKDFANAILLDVSGSVVQRGYPSRKFDQVVETAVLFIEIHERLKLPYEVIAFSDAPRVMRSFSEIAYDSMRIDPSSHYVVKDFSYLIRDMYALDHGETQEARAISQAVADIGGQPGLKTILIVTDGISSDRAALVDALVGIEERNAVRPPRERLRLLAFGVGLAEVEFKASYEPVIDDLPISCSRGTLVPKIDALPDIICRAVEERILSEGAE
ncbi:MAG TPA: vWA domain-containing protein [Chloroflexota bacterium]|nr:vWA domain-containing protein [Chloroflexota bacterium]